MFKFLPCFISIFFLTFNLIGEDFYYNKELIYKKKFDQIFKKYHKFFYADKAKKIFDLREGCADRNVEDANALNRCTGGNAGTIKGEVEKIINKNTFLLKVGNFSICISGDVDTSKMKDKTTFEGVIAPDGKYVLPPEKGKKKKKVVRKYKQLNVVTRDEFKNYIKNRKIYAYKKVEQEVPAKTVNCVKCKGKGQYLQHGSPGQPSKWRKCPVCGGKGNYPGKYKTRIIWQREEVK